MGVFTAFDIAASGMSAERYRMDIITQNMRMLIQQEQRTEHRM